ncbi:MAG TPA: CHAD domain-containing protein [Acidimicrobiia bacterium]|nr:CHAD domain-containing protein [Acidimicrobiia bacterium]
MTTVDPESVPSSDSGPHGPAIARDELLGSGLKRICQEYLDRAGNALAHPTKGREAGIHTARKAIKRVRAMIRLTRDVVGEEAYRNENAVLRAAARGLAGARDRAVLVLTLDRLCQDNAGSLPPGALAGLRERLAGGGRVDGGEPADRPGGVMDTLTTLRACHRRFAGWSPEGPGPGVVPNEFAAIAPGLRRVYRQGRNRMREAFRLGDPAAFHLWRKSAKYFRYHVEALEAAWPEVLGPLATAADRLAEILGDEHDFTLLGATVEADLQLLPDQAERRLLLALVAEEQDRLRAAARPLGELVYAEPPGAFVRRMGAYWAASRR